MGASSATVAPSCRKSTKPFDGLVIGGGALHGDAQRARPRRGEGMAETEQRVDDMQAPRGRRDVEQRVLLCVHNVDALSTLAVEAAELVEHVRV